MRVKGFRIQEVENAQEKDNMWLHVQGLRGKNVKCMVENLEKTKAGHFPHTKTFACPHTKIIHPPNFNKALQNSSKCSM